jgi:tRNA pseudouridine55 synthase
MQLARDRVFNIDKRPSVTSYGTVDQVKRLLGARRVGHAGSLDPFATGVLLVCTERATKITRFLMELDKEYVGTIKLGIETDTDDLTGEVISERRDFAVSRDELEKAVQSFVGTILQRPPKISALKRDGRRLYELARSGTEFETEARPVTVSKFSVVEFRSPEVDVRLTCSRGTYVRSLARDLGKALGCGGHLTALRRTRVGQFAIEGSVTVDELRLAVRAQREVSSAPAPASSRGSVSMGEALSFFPGLLLRDGARGSVLGGRSPVLEDFETPAGFVPAGETVRILSGDGELLAIGRAPSTPDDRVVKLERVLVVTR